VSFGVLGWCFKPDAEGINMGLRPVSTGPDLRPMSFEDAVEAVVEWFFKNFEDPINNTPWDQEEGGYVFVHGGPCDAREEIEDEYGPAINEGVLAATVNRIGDGVEWAPHCDRLYEDRDDDDQPAPAVGPDTSSIGPHS
jgi:hypothetical protein